MINAIITTIIGGLILLTIGLSLKIAQLTHRVHLLTKENEEIRKKQTDSVIENSAIRSEKAQLEKKITDLESNNGFASGSYTR